MKIFIAHPDNIDLLKAEFEKLEEDVKRIWEPDVIKVPGAHFMGEEYSFQENPLMDIYVKEWVWKQERFITYEECDKDWCQYFGIGGEWVETDQLLIYIMTPPNLFDSHMIDATRYYINSPRPLKFGIRGWDFPLFIKNHKGLITIATS